MINKGPASILLRLARLLSATLLCVVPAARLHSLENLVAVKTGELLREVMQLVVPVPRLANVCPGIGHKGVICILKLGFGTEDRFNRTSRVRAPIPALQGHQVRIARRVLFGLRSSGFRIFFGIGGAGVG